MVIFLYNVYFCLDDIEAADREGLQTQFSI